MGLTTTSWRRVSESAREQSQYAFAKRLLDVTLCLAMLPLAAALTVLVALAIRIESPGSPIFVQERVGRGGRRFRLFKFRTMDADFDDTNSWRFMKAYIRGQVKPSDENSAQVFKPNHGSHITRVGRALRKASLDELPQILNVLKGDMSLVGPRPHVLWEVEEYLPWHCQRLEVLPGITGLAQVRGRSGIPFERMVRHDLRYVRECCLLLPELCTAGAPEEG